MENKNKVEYWETYQADPQWSLEVKIKEFDSFELAKEYSQFLYAHKVKYNKIDCVLEVIYSDGSKKIITDQSEYIVELLKLESRKSAFITEHDFDRMDIKVHNFIYYPGLTSGYESLAYRIVDSITKEPFSL